VKLWNVMANKEEILLQERVSFAKEFSGGPASLSFSSDGKKLVAAELDGVQVWDVTSQKKLSSFNFPVHSLDSALSPDAQTLAASNFQDLDLWNVSTGKLRLTLPDHRGAVYRIAFSGDGKSVAVGSYRSEDEDRYFGHVKLWDTVTGRERATFKARPGFLRDLKLRPDGKALVLQEEEILGGEAELNLLAVPSEQLLGTVSFKGTKASPLCLTFSPDGKILAAGCLDGTVRLWDVRLPGEPKPAPAVPRK
jgi:WD40 repeat protein